MKKFKKIFGYFKIPITLLKDEKMNNEDESEIRVRGVGKELFKSAIKAAVEINKIEPVRLIFEVDCRNTNSLNAACKAMKDLQKEGLNINIFITGYYEIKNKDKSLTEAPTFILETQKALTKYR